MRFFFLLCLFLPNTCNTLYTLEPNFPYTKYGGQAMSHKSSKRSYSYVKKLFKPQHGRIPIDPANLAAIGHRFIAKKKRKLKMQTCGSEATHTETRNRRLFWGLFLWPLFWAIFFDTPPATGRPRTRRITQTFNNNRGRSYALPNATRTY